MARKGPHPLSRAALLASLSAVAALSSGCDQAIAYATGADLEFDEIQLKIPARAATKGETEEVTDFPRLAEKDRDPFATWEEHLKRVEPEVVAAKDNVKKRQLAASREKAIVEQLKAEVARNTPMVMRGSTGRNFAILAGQLAEEGETWKNAFRIEKITMDGVTLVELSNNRKHQVGFSVRISDTSNPWQ